MTADTDTTAVPLDDLDHWLKVIEHANAGIAALEERRKVARAHIEEALGDAETGTVGGVPRVRWAHVTSTRLDQSKAKRLLEQAGTLDAAMVETSSRRFVLVTPEDES